MKQTITFSNYTDTFRQMNRYDNYTYAGHRALFDYFQDLEDESGIEIELDVIAICCDYTQYQDLDELREQYPDICNLMDLQEHTTVIKCDDGSFIIQNF